MKAFLDFSNHLLCCLMPVQISNKILNFVPSSPLLFFSFSLLSTWSPFIYLIVQGLFSKLAWWLAQDHLIFFIVSIMCWSFVCSQVYFAFVCFFFNLEVSILIRFQASAPNDGRKKCMGHNFFFK